MCGICGIWNFRDRENINEPLLLSMTNSMYHRGPDNLGTYVDNSAGIGLGFRRLSIIDLSSSGNQPMSNEDNQIWIVLNGEIYNYQELRIRLKKNGHNFKSNTDTEVLIHLYEEIGIGFLDEVNGMFAIALWDKNKNQLILARDRLGKKPLYYAIDEKKITFASELTAIIKDRTIKRDLNPDAVQDYFRFGYIKSPNSILSQISKLPPAHYLVQEEHNSKIVKYWHPISSVCEHSTMSFEDWGDQIMWLLRDSVRIRMVSDVPLGAFLSGGIDSSAIVSFMAEFSNNPVKTFSIGFKNQKYNELEYADIVANRYGTDHHKYVVEPESIRNILPKLTKNFDEPFSDASALPTYHVSKIAKENVTVILTGDGGDEIFAGYKRYSKAIQRLWIDAIPQKIRELAFYLPSILIPPYFRLNLQTNYLQLNAMQRYIYNIENYVYQRLTYILNPDYCRDSKKSYYDKNINKEFDKLDFLLKLQYFDILNYLPGDILFKVDRMSMLNSLEARSPLLDYRLVELVLKTPQNLRINNGESKFILKHILRNRLPAEVINRQKMGFAIPGAQWLNDSKEFVFDVLSFRNLERRGIFQTKNLMKTINKALTYPSEYYEWIQVWSILVFELWCRSNLDQ